MELADNSEKRKELAQKFLKKGGTKNMKLLERMIKLRGEKAKILGYKNHADYKTEVRMAKSGDTALKFTTSLLDKVEKGGRDDLTLLRELKRKEVGNKNAELYSYDVGYYGNKLQKILFNVDSEEVRSYFPLKRVLEGTFNIYSTLFGVTFQKFNERKNVSLWHPDVELYTVKDLQGETLSYFALDLHPREGKYGHACALSVIDGRASSFKGGTYITPFAVMIANFTKPSETHPSLLSHSEVETFLHEFGHIMHCILTKAPHASQSGYHTAWDFVEAPSQMLEHWAWNKKPLSLLSAHYQTGKPLPEKILSNLIQSQRHMLRYATLRQLILGLLDLTLHTKNNPPEPGKLYRDLIKKHTGISVFKDAIFPAGFGHLAGGYDAGYYGYMWSNVYAADMFTRFEKEGILNKKTGAEYKRAILEQGGSEPELQLVKEFLGRKPNNKAFLKEIGL
jgi:thimet oligopeptidase